MEQLQQLLARLQSAGFRNAEGELAQHPAFKQLQQMAAPVDTLEFLDDSAPEEPFHIEADVYDSGDYLNLLVIPTNGIYIIVGNNEHLATLVKTCEDPACWEQQEGSLDEEIIEKLGAAIDGYLQSFN